jgi:hypothetical protein
MEEATDVTEFYVKRERREILRRVIDLEIPTSRASAETITDLC